MQKKMDKAGEQRLVRSVEQVIAMVNDGSHPTDALTKVSRDEKYSEDEILRIQDAYNQSATLHHLGSTSGMERRASFDLCDGDAVIKAVFPSSYSNSGELSAVKAAASMYDQPARTGVNYIDRINRQAIREDALASCPAMVKLASTRGPDPREIDRECRLAKDAADKASIELQRQLMAVSDTLRLNFEKLAFHELETAIYQQWGDAKSAQPLTQMLWDLSRAEEFGQRRASPHELDASNYTLMDVRGPAMASVENLVSSAVAFRKAARQWKSAESRAASSRVPDSPTHVSPAVNTFVQYKGEDGSDFPKEASLTGGVINTVRSGLGRLSEEARYQSALQSSLHDIEDPDLRDSLRQIRVRTMLNDFLANDEVISGYDPEEVVEYFNEIATLHPNVIDQPSIMRGTLRRALQQGQIEPFDAGQVLKMGLERDEDAPKPADQKLVTDALAEETATRELPRAGIPVGPGSNIASLVPWRPLQGSLRPEGETSADKDRALRRSETAARAAESRSRDKAQAKAEQSRESARREELRSRDAAADRARKVELGLAAFRDQGGTLDPNNPVDLYSIGSKFASHMNAFNKYTRAAQ